jgi:hypothetical protein
VPAGCVEGGTLGALVTLAMLMGGRVLCCCPGPDMIDGMGCDERRLTAKDELGFSRRDGELD